MAQPLTRAKVYRNVELRQEFFGLEPFDLIGLAAVGWVLMLIGRDAFLWDLVILVAVYVGVRIAKRGKPEGYTIAVLRHLFRRPFFSAAAPDEEVAARSFTPLAGVARQPVTDPRS